MWTAAILLASSSHCSSETEDLVVAVSSPDKGLKALQEGPWSMYLLISLNK
jgi:hypothetical protein